MKMSWLLSVVVALPLFGEEQKDDDVFTAGQMGRVIREKAREGVVRVVFSGGEWNWYSHHELELEPKKTPASIFPDLDEENARESLVEWIELHEVKAVQIQINSESPAEHFFRVEEILRGENVAYWMSVDSNCGDMSLVEIDGSARPWQLKPETVKPDTLTLPQRPAENRR